MAAGLILAVDQGTTNTKALLVDRLGSPVFRASTPAPLTTTAEGFVEQDPEQIWQSVLRVIGESRAFAEEREFSIDAVALSNQRETALAWDRATGDAAANAVSWQCGRGAAICERHADYADEFRARTGLPLAPLVSAAKWAWLLENIPEIHTLTAEDRLCLGTVDSWLIHRLTRGTAHATDHTNASRTGLLNLAALDWDRQILEVFGIPLSAMPALRPSSGSFGCCAAIHGLEQTPILAAIGDSHAALFGHGRLGAGTIKSTYGTGSSLMALTPSLAASTRSLARTLAWSIGDGTQFAVEGNIAMTGSALQWLGEFLQLPDPASGVAALADSVPDAAGLYFVPAMVGLGAPHWDANARGSITGLSRSHTSAHWARAALESIAFQVADVFFAMEQEAGVHFAELRADGGASRNPALMRFQADILGRTVVRSSTEELSALGAAWLAGLSLGWWKSLAEIESLASECDRFEPRMDEKRRNALYSGWKKAVRGVLSQKGGEA